MRAKEIVQKAITYLNRCGKFLVMNKTKAKNEGSANSTLEQSNFKSKFQVLPTPVKSASDKKDYRVILLENGLTACLISDPSPVDPPSEEDDASDCEEDEEDEEDIEVEEDDDEDSNVDSSSEQKLAACALTIGVGSFSDPANIPGMAHFLEHMVFMGSEKFPEENDFDSFLTRRGGRSNASTDCEVTTFYFESLEQDLFTALDKFAQFFISPLMKRGSIEREREAIESEFQIALPEDRNRKEQLIASFAKDKSPVNSFSWGNSITLKDNISEDDLYEKVHKFRDRHYSAHRMKLAIQARLPLDTLQSYVLECFSTVPTNNLPGDDFKKHGNVFDTPRFTKLYYIEPMAELTQLDLIWALPSLLDKYKSKPHQYVSFLIGDEGKGSLLSYLRKKVWVLNMSSGNGESGSEHNSLYAMYSINMALTDEGLENLNEIIQIVFSYINMLRNLGPQERIYKELKQINDTSFQFANEETAVDTVEGLSEGMHFYPPTDYISGSELFYEYDPKGIEMVLNSLVPRKLNVLVWSNTLPPGIKSNKVEPWFGTKYSEQDIPESWLKSWEDAVPLSEFSLPPPNQYLTEDFTILPDQHNHPEYPVLVYRSDLIKIWYRKDEKFKLPNAFFYLYLISPMAVETPLSMAMLHLYLNCLQIQLVEDAYPAQVAELTNRFKSDDRGIVIRFSGYNQKLHLLIDLVAKHIVEFESLITEEMFDAVKDKLIKFYYNSLIKPKSLATDIRLDVLVDNYHTIVDKYNSTPSITFNKFKQFSIDFKNKLFIKALVQGNVTENHAVNTVKKFVQTLSTSPIDLENYPKFRVIDVPKGEHHCVVKSFNKDDANSIITNYYQAGPFAVKESVIIEILMLILQEPLFDTLRTKEQLGYNVSCSNRETYGILGFSITVNAQATKTTAKHVDERIEEFIKQATEMLDKMTCKTFETTKSDLIKVKRAADVHLEEEVKRNWIKIVDDDYMFDRVKKEIAAIEPLTLKEVQEWWASHTSCGNRNEFKKLSVKVTGFNINEEAFKQNQAKEKRQQQISVALLDTDCTSDEKVAIASNFITNVGQFKKDLRLYPAASSKAFECS